MKKNKGFTLVEVIVILVILAILAAVLIPSLTTYIDKAKEKQITGNARAAFVATQAMASEAYGLDVKLADVDGKYTKGTSATTAAYPKSNPTDKFPTAIIDCAKYVDATTGYKLTEGDADSELLYIINLAQLTEVEEASVKATFGTTAKEAGNIATFSYAQKVGNATYTATHQSNGTWVVTKS